MTGAEDEAARPAARGARGRLYLRLYLTLLGATVICLVIVGVAFQLLRRTPMRPAERAQLAAAAVLEAAAERPTDFEASGPLRRLARELGVDLIVWDAAGAIVASAVDGPLPAPRRMRPGLHRRIGLLVVAVDDGRLVGIRARPQRRLPVHPFSATLVVLAVGMAVASYPVARRITRRIEALEAGVERWGRGDLSRRVEVDGEDEVARLAARFNHAAARIEALVSQQRQTLANASHELRSPLARIRLALDLLAEEERRERREAKVAEIARDVVELDALIEDLLLFARADAAAPRRPFEPVDLRAIAAEEARRVGSAIAVAGPAVTIAGDASLLRHLLRNLLENAHRHGGGAVQIAIEPGDDGVVVIAVEDEGPGIPADERERVFAPFYRLPGASAGGASGAGVGLALVRQVARHHGGEARVLPRAGGGSRFEVTLPRRPAPPG